MATTDPFRLGAPADGPHGTYGASEPALPRGEVVRTLLWILVVVSAVANTVATYAEAATWVHLTCGVVSLFGVVTLAVCHLRGRR